MINPQSIIIDAKSGVSGAGRKASLGMIYSENADNFKAYGVAGHRHHPEIVEALGNISGEKGQFIRSYFCSTSCTDDSWYVEYNLCRFD